MMNKILFIQIVLYIRTYEFRFKNIFFDKSRYYDISTILFENIRDNFVTLQINLLRNNRWKTIITYWDTNVLMNIMMK